MPRRLFALTIALAAFSDPTSAQSANRERCPEARTQYELNQCASEQLRRADADLNRTYQILIGPGQSASSRRLRTAQRAWIVFRDAHCDVESADYEGGSMQPMVRLICLATVTEARTAQLRARIEELERR